MSYRAHFESGDRGLKAQFVDEEATLTTLRAAAGGDRAALGELLEAHYSLMLRVARRVAGPETDPADIAQETAIRVACSIDRFRGDCTFKTWICRLTVNVARSMGRNRGRRRRREAAAVGVFPGGGCRGCHDTDGEKAVSDDGLERRWLEQALAALDTELRATAVLVLELGFTHAEAAVALEVRPGTVSWRIDRIRHHLRDVHLKDRAA